MNEDASNITPCNLNYPICDNCSPQLFPFTRLENDDFSQTLTVTNQEILGNDFSKFTSLKLHPVLDDMSSEECDFDLGDLYKNQNHNSDMTKCEYYLEDRFRSKISNYFSNNSPFSVLHFNVRSLINKLDDLQQYLEELEHKFSVIGISETWLNNDNESQIQLPGYSFVNNNRNTKTGGGVGMFISSVISFHIRNDLNLQRDGLLESFFIETCLRKNEKIIIGIIYRPPNNNFNEFEADLKTILHKVDKENKMCILMGDFNIDLIKSESSDHVNRFLHQMYSSHFYPVINRPTRITANLATLIDNIFNNNIHFDSFRGILINDLSDHLPVFQIFPSISTPEPKKIVLKKRAITKANMDKLRSEVQNINWEFLRTINDVDDAYSHFKETFMGLYNKCIPEKNLSNKERKIHKKPWITKGFIKSSKIKNKLYKKILNNGNEELKARYKYYRNHLNKLKNILKRRYYEQKFDTAKGDTKQTWKLVNEVINRKKRNTVSSAEFKKDNERISDEREVVNRFNEYFVNVGANLAKKITANTNSTFKSYLKGNYMESMLLTPVCEQEIKKELENLDPSKSCGHDNIMPKVVKQLATELSEPLSHIINLTFSTGKLPVDFKTSIVIPVYKSGDSCEFNNYRPISLLPCFSKILEKMMYKRLLNYLNKICLLSEHQFGFRKNNSTNFALIDLINKITTAIDNKEFAIGVFLDLSKAFDTADHSLLLQKLEFYGIRVIALEWFKSYITKRYQCVRYKNKISAKKEMTCGVPQGSVLGPLLFFSLY